MAVAGARPPCESISRGGRAFSPPYCPVRNVGKDFKIGLISGLVLAVLALIWVATRPSLSTHARMTGPSAPSSREDSSGGVTTPAPADGNVSSPTAPVTRREETLPPGLIAAEPQPSERPAPPPTRIEELAPARYEQEEKITTTRFHIVRQGENLSTISRQHYDSPNQWQKILEANKETLKDPNKIAPGMKLIIPD